jgi:TolB-like protein
MSRLFATALAAFTLVAFTAASSAEAQKRVDREREKKPPVVAVFPFKVLNKDDKLVHLGEGAADSSTTSRCASSRSRSSTRR